MAMDRSDSPRRVRIRCSPHAGLHDGTHDIKGGSVMMWLVLDALRALAPRVFTSVTWRLLWNSSEEVLSPDFGDLCRTRLGTDTLAALVFEAEGKGPGVRRLVVARKGRGTWRVRVAGRGAHAGVQPARGANAIVELSRVVRRIAAFSSITFSCTSNSGKVTDFDFLLMTIPIAPSSEWAHM